MGWTPLHLRPENRRSKPRRLFGRRAVVYRQVMSQNMHATIKHEKPKRGRRLALKRKDQWICAD